MRQRPAKTLHLCCASSRANPPRRSWRHWSPSSPPDPKWLRPHRPRPHRAGRPHIVGCGACSRPARGAGGPARSPANTSIRHLFPAIRHLFPTIRHLFPTIRHLFPAIRARIMGDTIGRTAGRCRTKPLWVDQRRQRMGELPQTLTRQERRSDQPEERTEPLITFGQRCVRGGSGVVGQAWSSAGIRPEVRWESAHEGAIR